MALWVWATLTVQGVGQLVLWPRLLLALQGCALASVAGLLPLGCGEGADERLGIADEPAGQQHL